VHVLLRFGLPVVLVAACGGTKSEAPAGSGSGSASGSSLTGSAAGSGDSRARCLAVRDHVVDLIAGAYLAEPNTTFDGLDRSDPHIAEGLDPAVTRETFGAFLATDPGKAWLERQKARAISAPAMADTVEKCVQLATQANLDCWLGSRNLPAFQLCPEPGT